MEFNKKLQELRKQQGLTQEELAEKLFVSRTAISKWESGRGLPSIESLKQIANLFSITIDDLLSGEELIDIAEHHGNKMKNHFYDLIFGLLDISVLMLLFLPFFAQKYDNSVAAVSLLAFDSIESHLKTLYLILVGVIALFGVLILALQNSTNSFWIKYKTKISILLNVLIAVVLIVGLHPYAAVFMFVQLIIKVLLLAKK